MNQESRTQERGEDVRVYRRSVKTGVSSNICETNPKIPVFLIDLYV